MEELTMKTLLSGVALATILALTSPGWAQGVTTQGQPSGQNAPGTAGTSKAGVPGLPGGKSGTTVTPSGKVPENTRSRPSGDQSGVQGLPGNKSGPTVKPPAAER
jgi:hypothetical protein